MEKSLTQKHPMTCGLACVAYITQTDYDVLTLPQPATKLFKLGFCCPELVQILKDLGYSYSWNKLTESEKDQQFKNGDIVFTASSLQRPGGHFLVKWNDVWMDPWINVSADARVADAQSGFRDSLPDRAEYLVRRQT